MCQGASPLDPGAGKPTSARPMKKERESGYTSRPIKDGVDVALAHDDRMRTREPRYLLPQEHRRPQVSVLSASLEALEAREAAKLALQSHQARSKGSRPFWEAVVNLADEPPDVLVERMRRWCAEYERMTNHTALYCSVHRDEGAEIDDGKGGKTVHYNVHAHVIIDRTNEHGSVIRLDKREMAETQSMTARVTGLKRGSTIESRRGAPARKHIPHAQWRLMKQREQEPPEDQEQTLERLTLERNHARAAEKAARDETKELYDILRDIMKASGVAKPKDYSAAKQIKSDISKLTDAIKFWREKAGDPPSPQTNSTSSSGSGGLHGSTKRRPGKRHDAAPLHPFLPGAVTLVGRTPRQREYAVRAMQKQLLDRNGAGLDVLLSRVVQRGMDDSPSGATSRVRRRTSGTGSRGVTQRSPDNSAPSSDDARETHAIYLELYHAMKAVGRIATRLPAAVSLRAKAEQYPEAKQHDKANDRSWLFQQLSEWQKRLEQAERLDSEAAGQLQTRVNAAETAVQHEKEEREADRIAHRHRRNYRPGFGGQGLDRREWFPFIELERQWDQYARCTAYKSPEGETWFVTTRNRVEVINQTDQSLAVALRVASKKFGNRIEITGPQEFRERAARLAARLGIEVVDADLQPIVTAERSALHQETRQDRSGPAIEPEAGRGQDDDDEPPRGRSR